MYKQLLVSFASSSKRSTTLAPDAPREALTAELRVAAVGERPVPFELFSALNLRPGCYRLRVAADIERIGRVGTVFADGKYRTFDGRPSRSRECDRHYAFVEGTLERA